LLPGGEAGVHHDFFLTKPIDVEFFLERVGLLLDLQWIEAPRVPELAEAASQAAADDVLPASLRPHVDALQQLGRIGHVRGIQTKLRDIVAADAGAAAFVSRLQQRVEAFDLKGYLALLDAAAPPDDKDRVTPPHD